MTKQEAIDAIKRYIECLKTDDSICNHFENCSECPYGHSTNVTGMTFMNELVDILEGKENDNIGTMSM